MSPPLPTPRSPERRRVFNRPSWAEAQLVADALRTETIGGAILLFAAVLAIALVNSPAADAYTALRDTEVGVEWGHLRLSLGHWAADGLLAIFFFVAGLELKREFIVGELRNPAKAAVPVVAAVCGVITPALVFFAVVSAMGGDGEALRGWAIPTATDIAFALAVLAVIGSHLPSALRSFLLTLAVVDDLIAITIIAVFYTSELHVLPLLLAVLPLAAFAFLVQRRLGQWWLLVPLAALTWGFVHASGVHATVAGVLLGLVVPVKPRRQVPSLSTMSRDTDVAHRFEHRMRPLSAGVAVPVFAFFGSGVAIAGGGLAEAVTDPVAVGVVLGLVVGKLVGVLGSTWVMARFTNAELHDDLTWSDVAGLSVLTGVGFTVSLLVGELAFGVGSDREEHVKLGILLGSLVSALIAAAILRRRNAVYRRIEEREARDADEEGRAERHEERAGPGEASTG
ncbi:Na+/H+ antiporter NhaA [Phycicoccus endophyticus]|uniref:Na(+)/H(+) antiporter NhaA n=1 Tax=Phycicoccus endophyticus TaxID=1690220 RepID=A0A7G9QZV5_9MICO|nr:Na+/H+ antiporter NhaA [Phycicoccus endophyticus]NHI20082.1 Na+/H+ antiporter NhaA [Phycicoccus endophyticus]QNN48880.1 Na+/H+ antiporter NhaA [Phycicoccus endophyticus]GGL45550.1 Na(+)/H(+) antiporter NhaA [Phycicoccus endophyticus]